MIRLFLTFVMLIAIGGAISGGIFLVKYLETRQFSAANTDVKFVELDEINIPVFSNGKLTETRTFGFTVETRNGNPLRLVLEQRPKLRDEYLKYLMALSTRAGPENIDQPGYAYLKDQLRKASDQILGPNVIYDVLVKYDGLRPVDAT